MLKAYYGNQPFMCPGPILGMKRTVAQLTY